MSTKTQQAKFAAHSILGEDVCMVTINVYAFLLSRS